jgi:tetratricopeptide (TPR) repeat protein
MLAPRIKGEFEETVKLDPKNLDAWRGLITFYTQAPGFMGGSYDKAFEVSNEIAKIDVAEGHRARGSIYSGQEKFDEAEKEYLAAYKLKPQLIGQLSAFYISRKQYDKSFRLAEEAAQKDPSNMSLIYIIGRTSAISGQRLDRGEECMKKYLAYQPKENEPSHGGAHMRLGQIYEKRGIKAEAKKSYEAAIKMDPTLKEAKDGLERVSK